MLELLTAIGIVAILSVLIIGATGTLRQRARRAHCVQNLKSLYAGAELYLQQQGHWPQINVDVTAETADEDYAAQWIAALEPFGVTRKTWICPEIETLVRDPDASAAENARLDYLPMPFDDKPTTPHEWPNQPWFIERGNVHGNGNLIIFTDGHVGDANELAPRR
jgi:type II secretory pathway pseudopilin PulG